MWWLLTRNNDDVEIDMSKSFYVGDGYSKIKSFSDSDLKFALNLGLKFYKDIYMKDEIFPKPIHPLELAECFDKYLNDEEPVPVDEQEMIILVGPPACGKDEFCKKFDDYVIASQDDLGTKQKVIKLTKKSLEEGQSIIINRKNEYIEDRKLFIDLAKDHNVPVRIVWFDITRELAEHLNAYRNIMSGKWIPAIVYNKYYSKEKGLEIPSVDEGGEVIKIHFKIDLSIVKNRTVFFNYLI